MSNVLKKNNRSEPKILNNKIPALGEIASDFSSTHTSHTQVLKMQMLYLRIHNQGVFSI